MSSKPVNSAQNDVRLTLRTLGEASLCYVAPNEPPRELLPAGKPLAMLVYLAHSPGKTASRDHLLELLWESHETEPAKHALRQAVWYIRKRLVSSPLTVGKGLVTLTAELDLDTARFQTAIQDGDFETAVELYTGPFMSDLALPGGSEFEQWAYAEGVRLESMLFRAAEIVVRNYHSEGRFKQAEKLARRIRDMAPFKEVGWRLLLEALVSAGDTVRAAVEASELEQLLESEGRTPERATLDLIRTAKQLPANRTESDESKTLVAELVGREREFATVIKAWERAQSGNGCHVAVTAAAGLGKTRLLNDIAGRLRAKGATVLQLRANHGERQLTYGFASHLARALAELPGAKGIAPACAATLVALNPSLSSFYETSADSVREPEALRRRIIALRELLAAVAHEQPLAMQIDDVHWMDDSSRKVVAGLAAGLNNIPVLMVTASRPVPTAMDKGNADESLDLVPLTEEQVGALVCSIATLPETGIASRISELVYSSTGGSPLLVLETLHLAIDTEVLELTDDGWSCHDEVALKALLEEGSALRRRVERLERNEAWVLLLLSTAGLTVSSQRLAKMAKQSPESLEATLTALERRGLVARLVNEYEPVHDEIGAFAIEVATDEARAAANDAVGRVIAEESWDNLQDLTVSGRFLAEANDSDRLEVVFRRCVWLARRLGDNRSFTVIARELVGQNTGSFPAGQLVRSLPLYVRLGLTSARRVAALLAVVLVAAITGTLLLARDPGPVPDAMLVAFLNIDNASLAAAETPIVRDHWDNTTALHAPTSGAAPIDSVYGSVAVPSPDGSQIAFGRLVGDSGGIEVFVRDRSGIERQLTFSPGDDKPTGWSPDGDYLIVTSARWNPRDRYEIGLLNPYNLELSRLTTSVDATELDARWSADGTRIAFNRVYEDNGFAEVCIQTVDGNTERCFQPDGLLPVELLGWRGPNELLMTVDSAGTVWLGALDVTSGTVSRITMNVGSTMSTSPDGQWIACNCRDSLRTGFRWIVYPSENPEQTKPILVDGNGEVSTVQWSSVGGLRTYLDSLDLFPDSVTIPPGVPISLIALGYDANGARMPVSNIRWEIDEPGTASIDSNGVLTGLVEGSVAVTANAAGWRSVTVRVPVRESQPRNALEEDWSEGWESRWSSFGIPKPLIVFDDDTLPAFLNNGDGSFNSGVYSKSIDPATNGYGVEAWISAPYTEAPSRNRLYIDLVGWLDADSLATWDHGEGNPPGQENARIKRMMCMIRYRQQRESNPPVIVLASAGEEQRLEFPANLDPEEWHLARLQVFPDGTCGAAIDGIPIGRTRERVILDVEYRVMLRGNSADARMLVGPLQVWTGVKTDVDWTTLDWAPW